MSEFSAARWEWAQVALAMVGMLGMIALFVVVPYALVRLIDWLDGDR